MKKKNSITIGIIIVLILITSIVLVLFLDTDKKTNINTYNKVNLNGYEFTINDNYKYKYLDDKKYAVLENEEFLTSYIYISNLEYSELIRKTSSYTNMGSEELDSSIEEMKIGSYLSFINVKKVYYEDVDKEYELVIILIKVNEKKTFVFQYEIETNDKNDEILEDIKESLSTIEEVNKE